MRWIAGAPMVRPRWVVVAVVAATVTVMLAAMVASGWLVGRMVERAMEPAPPAPVSSDHPVPVLLDPDYALSYRTERLRALSGGGLHDAGRIAWVSRAACPAPLGAGTFVPLGTETVSGSDAERPDPLAPSVPKRASVCVPMAPADFVAMAQSLGGDRAARW